MAEPTFNLFGPPQAKDLRVGYISTDRGYQTGMTVCQANEYAKLNPGTTFIFKPDRKTVEFLNINQVNKLASQPNVAYKDDTCPDGWKMDGIPKPPRVVFMGGGGVGAVANPVIGDDGGILAIDLVNGGFGYKYPPLVRIEDESGIGAGAVVNVDVGETGQEMIYYTDKDDFEEYDLCESPFPKDEYGRRFGPDGKDLGDWTPGSYTSDGSTPFAQVVDQFIKNVQESGKDWWTTRQKPPLRITTTGESGKSYFKVKHPGWGKFMNEYAISPKPPSNVKPSDYSGQWYTFEWNVDFPYEGEYTFRGARDNKSRFYIDNQSIGELSHFKGTVTPIKKTLKKGSKVLRLDLYNEPQYETVTEQQPPPPSISDIIFRITSGSMFANGVKIDELNINEIKPFTPVGMGKKGQLNVTHTRKITYGKKYKVVFSSKGEAGAKGYSIQYSGLKSPTDRRFASAKRLEFDDNSPNGFDVNGAFTIDSGDAKFSEDGTKLIGKGQVKLTYSWNDIPTTSGKALETIKIGNRTWTQLNVRRGSETYTIDLGPGDTGANISNIKLRTKGSNVIQMEDHTDNDWTDIIVTASGGQFTDLKGNIAYFSVPHPGQGGGKSTGSQGTETREVFNTVDYINKANRQLWRTNVYSRGGFLNDYGVCPFDTQLQLKDNPYAGTHRIIWNNVNFPIDGNYTIEVAVDDNVDLTIGDQVRLNKKGFIGDSNVSTGTLRTTKFIKKGNHNITADLHQIPGGAFGFKSPDGKKTMTKVKFNINVQGNYGNNITIPGLLSIGKQYKAAASAFNQERELEVGKEYDVIITTIRSRGEAASSNVRKGAIRFRTSKDGSGELGKSGPRLEYEDRLGRVKKGDHGDITATASQGRFYNVNGNRCKFMVGESMKGINPMALAINIETEFTTKVVKAKRSWNENPMGVALTIESPNPPIPQQPVPQAEGRCPNNPFWTSRFPGGKERWYPVRFKGWSPFFNELAMSPLPPDDEGDSRNDSGSFANTWTKEFPYGGYYKVIMEVDDIGEFWIDDTKHISLDRRKKDKDGGDLTRGEKLIYIEGPDSSDDDPVTHDIKVVVENFKSQRTRTFDQKVFSTLDWIGGGTSKTTHKRVNFKITSAADFANGIKIPGLGIDASKRYKGPQINAKFIKDVEVNKVYQVEVISTQSREGVQLRSRGESVLEMEEHSDNDWKDIVCGASAGRFYDFKPGPNKATCKFRVTGETGVSGGVTSNTTRQGVTYEGPHLFHYTDSRWGKIINKEGVSPIGSPTQKLSLPNSNIIGTKKLKWNNVDFPKTGDYHITFLADNGATLFIGGKKVLASKTYEINEYINDVVKVDKGKHDILVELNNAPPGGNVFLNNPTGVVIRITTKMTAGTGEYKPWTENPVGVAVKLIPPPCPKPIKGKGKVKDPIVRDPGNGYPKGGGSKYPVLLKIKKAIPDGNPINYNCKTDKVRLEPSMGSELELVCGPFGTITDIIVKKPGLGFTKVPDVIIDTDTGVGLDVILQFEPEVAPFDVPDVIQVTDLVGLKQTGYYKGKPYYGAVFYQDGIKYSGWYRTAGELVQVYDTLQESIDAQVTTPPSAILRQGSDTSSNDPRLNIPGTPENLL